MDIEITADNSEEVLDAIRRAMPRALEKCGMQAVNYAKLECAVDTGLLRNSLTYALSGKSPNISSYSSDTGGMSGSYRGTAPNDDNEAVYIGTNVEYAAYVEMGHIATNGAHVPAQPYIRPAAEKHADEYKKIIQDELKNA